LQKTEALGHPAHERVTSRPFSQGYSDVRAMSAGISGRLAARSLTEAGE